MVQLQTTLNTLMKIVALAMQILGTKNEAELKTALSKMSEVGRTKFIQQCSNIILTGDQSPESLKQAQLLAQMALEEGPEQDYALMAKHGAAINRYYFGGRVKTYDGNYMDLKKPLNKDLVEGREAIGVYKGQWMYLNGDKIAVPRGKAKGKSYDGTAHINRAYQGMLLPKPYKYEGGGIFNTIGKGMEWLQKSANNWNKKYGIDLSGALSTLTSGLANTFNMPLFNTFGTLFDTLFTTTPPNPQTSEEPEDKEGKGKVDNGAPSLNLVLIDEDKKQKLTNLLLEFGLDDDTIAAILNLLNNNPNNNPGDNPTLQL